VRLGSSAAKLVGMVLHSPFWTVLGSCRNNLCTWGRQHNSRGKCVSYSELSTI